MRFQSRKWLSWLHVPWRSRSPDGVQRSGLINLNCPKEPTRADIGSILRVTKQRLTALCCRLCEIEGQPQNIQGPQSVRILLRPQVSEAISTTKPLYRWNCSGPHVEK